MKTEVDELLLLANTSKSLRQAEKSILGLGEEKKMPRQAQEGMAMNLSCKNRRRMSGVTD